MNTHPQPLSILGLLTCSGCQGPEHVSECTRKAERSENRKHSLPKNTALSMLMDITYVHTLRRTINTRTLWPPVFSASVRLYSSSGSHTSAQRTRVGRPRSMHFPPCTSADAFPSHVRGETRTAHICKHNSCLLNTLYAYERALTHTGGTCPQIPGDPFTPRRKREIPQLKLSPEPRQLLACITYRQDHSGFLLPPLLE